MDASSISLSKCLRPAITKVFGCYWDTTSNCQLSRGQLVAEAFSVSRCLPRSLSLFVCLFRFRCVCVIGLSDCVCQLLLLILLLSSFTVMFAGQHQHHHQQQVSLHFDLSFPLILEAAAEKVKVATRWHATKAERSAVSQCQSVVFSSSLSLPS